MRRWFLASIAAALAVVLAGCGSGKPGSGTAPAGDLGSASGSITAAAAVDEVAKLTDPNSALFDYTPFLPTQRVAPKAGARIAVVAAAMSSPVVKQYATAVIDAAEVAGFNAQTLDGKFQVDTQSSLIEQAVQHRYDGIVLVGVGRRLVDSTLRGVGESLEHAV